MPIPTAKRLKTLLVDANAAHQEARSALQSLGLCVHEACVWLKAPPYDPNDTRDPRIGTPVSFSTLSPPSAHARLATARALGGIKTRLHEACLPLLQTLHDALPAVQGPAGQCSLTSNSRNLLAIHANHHLVRRQEIGAMRMDDLLAFFQKTKGCAPATHLYLDHQGRAISASGPQEAQTFMEAATDMYTHRSDLHLLMRPVPLPAWMQDTPTPA